MNLNNKKGLEEYILLQKVVLTLSERFIHVEYDKVDEAIQSALQILGEAVDSDRTYVFTYDFKRSTTTNTYEWCQEGIPPEIDNLQDLPISIIQEWVNSHLKGNIYSLSDVETVSEPELKEVLIAQNIKSLITVPMFIQDEVYGFVGFDSVKRQKEYTDQEAQLLIVFANLLVGLIERVRLEKQVIESQKLLKNVLDTIPSRVFWKDAEGKYLGANKSFLSDSGLNSEQHLIGKTDYDLVWKELADKYREDDLEVIEGNTMLEYEEKLHDKNAEIQWVQTSKIPLKDVENSVIGVLGTYEIITEQKKLEQELKAKQEALKQENARFNRMVASTQDIIFEIDRDFKHISIYGTLMKKNGLSKDAFIGKTAEEFFGKERGKVHMDYAKRALQGEEVSYEWQTPNATATQYYQTTLSPIYDEHNNVIGAVGISRDITDKAKYIEEIEYLNYHDYLTKLYNRRYFEKMLEKLESEKQYPYSVFMIDLNGLKLFNDAFGHATGDQALKAVANVLQDTVNSKDIVARVGGDEFALIVPGALEEDCIVLMKSIEEALRGVEIENIELSIALGYETKIDDQITLESVLESAENFMYKRKLMDGRSRYNKTIQTMLKSLNDKYPTEKRHAKRVSQIAYYIGKELKLSKNQLDELSLAASLHDIGKITVPDSIIEKKEMLSHKEQNTVRKHTINGYQLLRASEEYADIAKYTLTHHERVDGKGYPKGLKDKDIPLYSRIISIAEAYEVMTTNQPYRKALGKEAAIKELQKNAGTQFDKELVNLFINQVIQAYPNL